MNNKWKAHNARARLGLSSPIRLRVRLMVEGLSVDVNPVGDGDTVWHTFVLGFAQILHDLRYSDGMGGKEDTRPMPGYD